MEGKISLKAARINANLTLGDVAAIMQVTPRTVSNWESNTTKVDGRDLLELCALYRINPTEIFLPPISNKVEKD